MEKKKPIEKYRSGPVEAAVWENTGKNGLFYTLSVSRTFKNKEGNLQETNSYGVDTFPHLAVAGFRAWFSLLKKGNSVEQTD